MLPTNYVIRDIVFIIISKIAERFKIIIFNSDNRRVKLIDLNNEIKQQQCIAGITCKLPYRLTSL